MSGHSKWANIKRRKEAVDAKKGKIFSRLAREIMVAARLGGGDPEANPRLRLAIDRARKANMPQDNIKRAIQRGTGELEGSQYEEVVYEGYAPGGIALVIETLTDNRNRTTAEIRAVFNKYGGNLAERGAVTWNFHKMGVFTLKNSDEEKIVEAAIEAGALDYEVNDDEIIVKSSFEDFDSVKKALEKSGFEIIEANIELIPESYVSVDEETARKVLKIVEVLEDIDDVQRVTTNCDLPEEVLQTLQ